jgi:hypothetical protein
VASVAGFYIIIVLGRVMAKIELTEAEKREMLECLEKGKPLDDRFRFLLFGDKRNAKLIFNNDIENH